MSDWVRIYRMLICACLFAGSVMTFQPANGKQPNILFILADDVGSEVLECYGGESYATPSLNQLASEGMRFEHAYSMAVCHPTRISLLSGQYPFRMGHPDWGTYPRALESQTFAHALKDAGYATAIAGKWQLTLLGEDPDHPHRLGFDQYCLFGWHEGPRYYLPHIRQNGHLRDDVADRYGPDVYVEFLIDFMTQQRQKPFFAFYSMALCHEVTDDLESPPPVGPNGRYQTFAEMVTAMDQRVGRIVAALDEAGLREETLVIFYSDNGSPHHNINDARGNEYLEAPVVSQRNGQKVPGGKAQLTDAGTRVPLLIRWPTQVETGAVNDQLVDVTDFYPTFAEVAGAEVPTEATLDGQSFVPGLKGEQGSQRDWVFAEHKERSFVKNQRWKLYNDGRYIDVENDPQEKQPLDTENLSPKAAVAYEKLSDAFDSLRSEGL